VDRRTLASYPQREDLTPEQIVVAWINDEWVVARRDQPIAARSSLTAAILYFVQGAWLEGGFQTKEQGVGVSFLADGCKSMLPSCPLDRDGRHLSAK
jgi:hypothetical protein